MTAVMWSRAGLVHEMPDFIPIATCGETIPDGEVVVTDNQIRVYKLPRCDRCYPPRKTGGAT